MEPASRDVSIEFCSGSLCKCYIHYDFVDTANLKELTVNFERLSDAEGKACIYLKLLEIEEKLDARTGVTASVDAASLPKLPLSLPVGTNDEFEELERCLSDGDGQDILVSIKAFYNKKRTESSFPVVHVLCFEFKISVYKLRIVFTE